MIKCKKTILATVCGVLALMSFHPIGRMVVKWILPLGFGIMDLIGTAFLIISLLILLYPRGWLKNFLTKKSKVSSTDVDYSKDKNIQSFIFELTKRDKTYEFVQSFMNVIEVANKRDKSFLVEKFVDYYGQLTIKLLDSKEDLSTHNTSAEIRETTANIEQALNDIKKICDKFIAKLISGDIIDINANIKVLGIISTTENLI